MSGAINDEVIIEIPVTPPLTIWNGIKKKPHPILKIKVPKIIIGLAAIVILIVVGYFIVSNYKGNDFSDNDITYSIRR